MSEPRIGARLKRILSGDLGLTELVSMAYSVVQTIIPICVVFVNVLLMEYALGFDQTDYADRELFSCTLLYIFIFALLSCSLFNAVLSRFISDAIYEERFQDIRSCFCLGLFLIVLLSTLLGAPFCLWEYHVGHVDALYVFTGFCGYISMALAYYSMLYLSITKSYGRISLFYTLAMMFSFFLSLVLVYVLHWEVTYSMLFSLSAGFLLLACLETAQVKQYFPGNSNSYGAVLRYFQRFWQLCLSNFLYVLGLYIHNFVFWTTDMRMVVADSFVCCPAYDMASCFAMFTNISATIIFTTRIEMNFHERYRAYSEAVIGQRGSDIERARSRMFRQVAQELVSLARIQFVISIVAFFVLMLALPRFGFSGPVLRIYPCLAAGYFILFLMYAAIILLYYFEDGAGALLASGVFLLGVLFGSIFSARLTDIWYGLGVVIGAFLGWNTAYYRMRRMEKHWDIHIFCRGTLLKSHILRWGQSAPSSKVYDRHQAPQAEDRAVPPSPAGKPEADESPAAAAEENR